MQQHNGTVSIEASAADPAAAPPLSPPHDAVGTRPPQVARGEAEPAGTEILKVSTRSRPSAVAGAIAGVVRTSGNVEVQSIGAGATNQAVKAIAIARAYLYDDGIDICFTPSFIDIAIDGEERTALRLLVQPYTG
jgi:stage V sporulation protein S